MEFNYSLNVILSHSWKWGFGLYYFNIFCVFIQFALFCVLIKSTKKIKRRYLRQVETSKEEIKWFEDKAKQIKEHEKDGICLDGYETMRRMNEKIIVKIGDDLESERHYYIGHCILTVSVLAYAVLSASQVFN